MVVAVQRRALIEGEYVLARANACSLFVFVDIFLESIRLLFISLAAALIVDVVALVVIVCLCCKS